MTERFNGHTEGDKTLVEAGLSGGGRGPEAEVGTTLGTNTAMWLSTSFVPGAEKVGLEASADDRGRGFVCVLQAIVALAPR